MHRSLFLCVLIFIAFEVFAAPPSASLTPTGLHSAARSPRESANQAYQRYIQRLGIFSQSLPSDSALSVAVPFAQLDLSKVPQWTAQISLEKAFATIRDTRFLNDPLKQNFKRRSSWLYPNDGCFARAGLMRVNLEKMKTNTPAKLFIFGNLTVKTSNSPDGSVSWWYHVVPLVQRGQQLYVFDPAIDARGPLLLRDWIMTMTNDISSVRLSVCKGAAYVPSSSCMSPGTDDDHAMADQPGYLQEERNQLVRMGRNADEELGENPPWPHSQLRGLDISYGGVPQ